MSASTALAPQPTHMTGPTWQKTQDGQWNLPELTLGWQVLNWVAEYVLTPGGDHAGEPFMPTLEQARFVLWWYAVDKNGQFTYRNGVLRRMKGWGKDPLAALISLVDLCGPTCFDCFDAAGNPVGKPRYAAWVQVCAVSQEQTKNTFSLFPVMVGQKLRDDYGLEVNKTIVYSRAGGRIEAVTSSPYAMEGNRPTLVIQNETQWWMEANDGVAMAGVVDGNVTKGTAARKLSICNAHIPGEDSVAERDYDLWMAIKAGQAMDTNVLYDALEAPADTPLSEIPTLKDDPEGHEKGLQRLMEGLQVARGDSYWLPLNTMMQSVLDIRNPVSESRRKFLNQVNAHEDSWLAPWQWDSIAMTDEVFRLKERDTIALGFDGSKSNDWTALVACRINDGMLFPIRVWNPEKFDNHEVPRDDVDQVVRSMFEKYDVIAFRADVKEFEAYVDNWTKDFKRKLKINASPGNPVAFDMRGQRKKFALDCERFFDAVVEHEIYHNGDAVLRQHVLNARRHPTTYDAISIRKASKDSSRKIDCAVAAVIAFGARQEFLMSKRSRTGRVTVIE